MDMADAPAALLAGGLATRLRPLTETIPKSLVEVAGRPFVEHQLRLLARHGVRRVVMCVGHLGEQIEAILGSRACGVDLAYSYDGARPLGTGGALRRAAPLLGEASWVVYGDSYADIDYAGVWRTFRTSGAPAVMVVLRNDGRWDRSNAVVRDGALVRYHKHRADPEMTYIDHGVALLSREIVARLPEDQPSDLADLYAALVDERRMIGYEVHERFYEIGSPAGLADTRAHLAAIGSGT
jgi:NDP-sugar pyrophosphorylase family protein